MERGDADYINPCGKYGQSVWFEKFGKQPTFASFPIIYI